mgnify:CR=1 FL=1
MRQGAGKGAEGGEMRVLDKLIKYAEGMKEVELSLIGDCDEDSIKEKKAILARGEETIMPLMTAVATELEDGTLIKKAIRKMVK